MTTDDAAASPSQPRMNILSQYVQDVSFANHASQRGASPKGKPTINVQVNVETDDLQNERHRVLLAIAIEAKSLDEQVFSLKLDYAGVFKLQNVPEKSITPILQVEAPRLLFPFARRIIAELTRDGGYPPLMLDPIDFALLYRRRLAGAADAKAQQADAEPLNKRLQPVEE